MSVLANSAQVANSLAFPVVKNRPTDYYGRVREIHWVYKTNGTETTGSILTLAPLPPGAKVIGGSLVTGALGTSATASVGLVNGLGWVEDGNVPSQTLAAAGSGTEFLSAGAVATAGAVAIAQTLAQNWGYLIAEPAAAAVGQANQTTPLGDTLILTTGGATYATGILITGYILVVVD